MGRVYRATQMGLNRQVALKLIMPELPPSRTSSALRARVAPDRVDRAPERDPGLRGGRRGGQLFIAMRWVEGPTCGR